MTEMIKCACVSCQCRVPKDKAIQKDGKWYCSSVCAYDCTDKTCVCIHDRCGGK